MLLCTGGGCVLGVWSAEGEGVRAGLEEPLEKQSTLFVTISKYCTHTHTRTYTHTCTHTYKTHIHTHTHLEP